VDITDALKSGDNELEIEVVNSWPNRLIGDAKLPTEQRRTRTNITQYEKPENQTLVPSGMLGPVTLQTIQNHQNASHKYQSFPIGWLNFPKPGKYKVSVVCLEGNLDTASLKSISFNAVNK
jgi:hypothetical protein